MASEVGSSVSVVSGQDIHDRAALNVLDVLSGIPGVEVSQAGRYGGVTGVYVRGGQSNYNLVMVDGIELNEFGGAFDFAPLPADGVERVEVTSRSGKRALRPKRRHQCDQHRDHSG